LYSALATLPALKWIGLSNNLRQDESALAHPESLTELLRVPSLQSARFYKFDFTSALCQAAANALMEGAVITNLQFRYCSFSAEGGATILASALSKNTSVSLIQVVSPSDDVIGNALAAALPLNTTLQDIYFSDSYPVVSPLLFLGQNKGLNTLIIGGSWLVDESLCTAIQNGLGMNETLESLKFEQSRICDDNADLWCRAFSFLRTNKAIKSLIIELRDATKSCVVAALCRHIAAMLQDNASLESLVIQSVNKMKAEDYLAFIAALQDNTTLKTLQFYGYGYQLLTQLTDDENKQIAKTLKKN
jgi:hypothetical protein